MSPIAAESSELEMDFPELEADETAAVVEKVRSGIPAQRFELLSKLVGITKKELADIVGIPKSTLYRRQEEGHFKKDESERLLRIASIFAHALDVLGSVENARKWLTEPSRALGGETPLHFADTEPGAREVENLLTRLEHGVYT